MIDDRQFGNMLVLSVTYKSHLDFMIDKTELMSLYDCTIALLDMLSPISKTLALERNILVAIRQNIHVPFPTPASTTATSN